MCATSLTPSIFVFIFNVSVATYKDVQKKKLEWNEMESEDSFNRGGRQTVKKSAPSLKECNVHHHYDKTKYANLADSQELIKTWKIKESSVSFINCAYP